MPSRWWLPLPDARPDRVKLEHLHAVISSWFDTTVEAHKAQTKRFAISPLTQSRGILGCEIGLLETALSAPLPIDSETQPDPRRQLLEHIQQGTMIRLGCDRVAVGAAEPIMTETWESLSTPSHARKWTLEFVTPAAFRHGNRTSPLPTPTTVLRSLLASWNGASGLHRQLARAESDAVWVSDIAGRSTTLKLSGLLVSGFTGHVTYRCDDEAVSGVVDGLFRLAAYAGCGSARAKGLGVTRVTHNGNGTTRTVQR